MNATDRWRILANITAQMGTDNVDLYAELAKAEGMINLMETQGQMAEPPPMTGGETPPMPEQPEQSEQVEPM